MCTRTDIESCEAVEGAENSSKPRNDITKRRDKGATATNKLLRVLRRQWISSKFLFPAQRHHHTQLGSGRCQASAVLNISKRPEEFAITQHFDLAPHQPPTPPPRAPSATTVRYQPRVTFIAPDISSR